MSAICGAIQATAGGLQEPPLKAQAPTEPLEAGRLAQPLQAASCEVKAGRQACAPLIRRISEPLIFNLKLRIYKKARNRIPTCKKLLQSPRFGNIME